MGPSDILSEGMPTRGMGCVKKSFIPPSKAIFSSTVNLPSRISTRLSISACVSCAFWALPGPCNSMAAMKIMPSLAISCRVFLTSFISILLLALSNFRILETGRAVFNLDSLKPALRIGGRGGSANNQLGWDGKLYRIIAKSVEPLQQNSRRSLSNISQRLPNGRQSGCMVSRELDVVEADHGNVLRHVQIGIPQGANCSRCEFQHWLPGSHEIFHCGTRRVWPAEYVI